MLKRGFLAAGMTALLVGAAAGRSMPSARHAPSIESATWINSAPLTDARLRGHPVLVEFWTFGCINCQRTIPAMRALDAKWRTRGVVVLGIHRPEFEAESAPSAVRAAVRAAHIAFPVCLDNDAALWRAFGVQAWPSLYVLDAQGAIRWTHVGELHRGDDAWQSLQASLESLMPK